MQGKVNYRKVRGQRGERGEREERSGLQKSRRIVPVKLTRESTYYVHLGWKVETILTQEYAIFQNKFHQM